MLVACHVSVLQPGLMLASRLYDCSSSSSSRWHGEARDDDKWFKGVSISSLRDSNSNKRPTAAECSIVITPSRHGCSFNLHLSASLLFAWLSSLILSACTQTQTSTFERHKVIKKQRSAWVSAEFTVIDACRFMLVLIHCLLMYWWQFGTATKLLYLRLVDYSAWSSLHG